MAVLSCLKYTTIPNKCVEYVHPWTDSCRDATLGLLLHSFKHSLRTYTTLYLFTAIMRRKGISKKMILQTITAILQSTAFLTTHSYGYAMCLCALRRITGSFNILTASFIPAFISSLVAINIERPSRHLILCLYVTNVATETLFRMAADRGWVTPIRYGEVAIFSISAASLLYRFRGDHSDDAIFSVMRYVVGSSEEGGADGRKATKSGSGSGSRCVKSVCNMAIVSRALNIYNSLIARLKSQPKAICCPHTHSCLYYTLQGGAKMLAAGYGIQVLLKIVLSLRKILRKPSTLMNLLVAKGVINLGAFLASFTAIFRGVSCLLRWKNGKDSQVHALPAAALAGLAFSFYPDNTAALYIMWKAIQMLYSDMVDGGYLPSIPHGTIILYCFSTAVLFHAAFLEPQNLRLSYVRFLDGLSGGRVVAMSRRPLDQFGLDTSQNLAKIVKKANINPNPRYKFQLFGNRYPPLPQN